MPRFAPFPCHPYITHVPLPPRLHPPTCPPTHPISHTPSPTLPSLSHISRRRGVATRRICEHSENGLLDFPAVKVRALELRTAPGLMATHPMSTLLDVYELEAKAGQTDATAAAVSLW